jgi:hypothetical protein
MPRVLTWILLPGLLLVTGTGCMAGEGSQYGQVIVTDKVTGLSWTGCAARTLGAAGCEDGTDLPMDHDQAQSHCLALFWGSFDDWYLPDIKEVTSLVDDREADPAIDTVFKATQSVPFWSGSPSVQDSASEAWVVDFADGSVLTAAKSEEHLVRCVRLWR